LRRPTWKLEEQNAAPGGVGNSKNGIKKRPSSEEKKEGERFTKVKGPLKLYVTRKRKAAHQQTNDVQGAEALQKKKSHALYRERGVQHRSHRREMLTQSGQEW